MRDLLEGHKRVAASAQARNSREQSKKQALYKVSRGNFLGWQFLGWGIGKISSKAK